MGCWPNADSKAAVTATSAGTKGTELVLGEGVNPVTTAIMEQIVHLRNNGLTPTAVDDAARAARAVQPGA